MSQRQISLNCSGHTRPVVHLDFSDNTTCGYFLISACKGQSVTFFQSKFLAERVHDTCRWPYFRSDRETANLHLLSIFTSGDLVPHNLCISLIQRCDIWLRLMSSREQHSVKESAIRTFAILDLTFPNFLYLRSFGNMTDKWIVLSTFWLNPIKNTSELHPY